MNFETRSVNWSVLILALALASCGGAPDAEQKPTADTPSIALPDTAYGGPKACELVSAADIERVTGTKVKAGITTNDYAGDSQCRFDLQDGAHGVMVTLHAHGRIEPYRGVPGSEELAGLGDNAIWSETNGQLAVRRGDAVFSISFLTEPRKKQWATELARGALGALSPTP